MSAAEMEEVKRKEGDRILAHIAPDTFVITLEIQGNMLTSEQLAKKLDELATYGKSKIAFVIGGSLGTSKEVESRSDLALSFSKMTFPHQLMRLLLLEQIYRGFRINRGNRIISKCEYKRSYLNRCYSNVLGSLLFYRRELFSNHDISPF